MMAIFGVILTIGMIVMFPLASLLFLVVLFLKENQRTDLSHLKGGKSHEWDGDKSLWRKEDR